MTESDSPSRVTVRVTRSPLSGAMLRVGSCSVEVDPSANSHSHAVGSPRDSSVKLTPTAGHEVGLVASWSTSKEKAATSPVPEPVGRRADGVGVVVGRGAGGRRQQQGDHPEDEHGHPWGRAASRSVGSPDPHQGMCSMSAAPMDPERTA